MNIEKRKKILNDELIDSFVEDYKIYKNTVEFINRNFQNANINLKYTYDEFCVDFLNQSMKNIEEIDIFSFNEYQQFYENFWKFNLYNLKCMLTSKLQENGYKFEDVYDTDNMEQKVINEKLNK